MGTHMQMVREVRREGVWCADLEECRECYVHCTSCGAGDEDDADIELWHTGGKCLYTPGALSLARTECTDCDERGCVAAAVYPRRDPALYELLGGISGASTDGFTQRHRGAPDDMSAHVERLLRDNGDVFFAHGWYTLRELRRRSWRDLPEFNAYVNTLALGTGVRVNTDDVRVIFWFHS